jgi:DNA-binding FadR family transcriptional regulator
MTLLSPAFVSAALERPSFWRRLVDAIETGQRRRAEQVITAHLRRHGGEHHDEFTRELERRFVGQ